jgi:hypothetical protein
MVDQKHKNNKISPSIIEESPKSGADYEQGGFGAYLGKSRMSLYNTSPKKDRPYYDNTITLIS